MSIILIILSSLFFLISCTEEKDNSQEQSNSINTITNTSAPTKINPSVPPQEKLEDASNNNTSNISEDSYDADLPLNIQDIQDIPASQEADISNLGDVITAENDVEATVESTKADNISSPEKSSPNVLTNKKGGNDEIFEAPTFKVNKNDIVLGNANSKVVFIEYYSPTCPHCAYYNKIILPQLKKKYTDTNKIAYVIREFIGNKEDLDAAILQRCANNIDSFLKFQAVLLEQQDKWAGTNQYRTLLTNIGKIGGISADTYATCLKDDQIIKMLIANTNLASNAPNFIGTPSFFINGGR